jgi:predicted nucleic acid-binding protein
VTRLVVDASIAIKWVVQETGTAEALSLRPGHQLLAPELLAAECANILWKKVVRGELTSAQAQFAARLLQRADLELVPMRSLMPLATDIAMELNHPAYDCIYLALALEHGVPFVTVDERLLQRLRRSRYAGQVIRPEQATAAQP